MRGGEKMTLPGTPSDQVRDICEPLVAAAWALAVAAERRHENAPDLGEQDEGIGGGGGI